MTNSGSGESTAPPSPAIAKSARASSAPGKRHYLIIGAVCLLMHGLLLLNDGVYWDGWLIYTFLKFGDYERLHSWFSQSGALPFYYLHRFMGLFPGIVFGYKLVAFAMLLASSLLIYRIGVRSALVSRRESLLIALLALSYPAFQVSVELVVLPFLVTYVLFLGGVLLALGADSPHRTVSALRTALACLAFFLSFFIGSLLVFYVGFLILLVRSRSVRACSQALRSDNESAPATPKKTGRLRGRLPVETHYLLLPLVFWAVKSTFFAPWGLYKHYNEFRLAPRSLAYSVYTFFASAIYDQLVAAFQLAAQPAILVLLLLGIGSAYYLYRSKGVAAKTVWTGATSARTLLFYGGLLLALAILPYAVVAKPPSSFGYDTRNSLLIGLPMAIILVGLGRLLFSMEAQAFTRASWLSFAGLGLLFLVTNWNYYVTWQARAIKYHSLVAALAADRPASRYSVYWVDDQFLTGGEELYSFQELTSMFRLAWGGESRMGIDIRSIYWVNALIEQPQLFIRPFSRHYNLSDCDPRGPQARLLICRGGAGESNIGLVANYYFRKFVTPHTLPNYLGRVTDIRVVPVENPANRPPPPKPE